MSVIPTNWNTTSPLSNVELMAAEFAMKNISPLYVKVAVALPAVRSLADIDAPSAPPMTPAAVVVPTADAAVPLVLSYHYLCQTG